MLRGLVAIADPASARERELKARAQRHVTFWRESLDGGGCRDLAGRLDLADAVALEGTLDRIAETLAELGDTNELDIRRATALGILADPSRSQRLLEEGTDTGSATTTTPYDHSRGCPPGQTRIDNLAPLTRKPHRAKTARRWRVFQDENGWLEWTSPAGYRYAVGPLGTLPLATAPMSEDAA